MGLDRELKEYGAALYCIEENIDTADPNAMFMFQMHAIMAQRSERVGITIRAATADDAREIAALLAELGYPTVASEISTRMTSLTDAGGAVFLAVQDGEPPLGLMCLDRHVALRELASPPSEGDWDVKAEIGRCPRGGVGDEA